MKKLYVCFVWGLVLVSTASMSQSLSLNNGTDDFSNDTLYVFGTTDSVLLEAPSELQLEFPYDVRLVKLTLRNELRDWVDIDFRYDPTTQEKFLWTILREIGRKTVLYHIMSYLKK